MYKKILIILEIVFSLTAVLFYFITENLILTIIYAVICLGSAAFLSLFLFRNYENKKNKYSECVSFINKFIISLSINGSLLDSFNACKEIINDKLYLQLKAFDEVENRLEYLKKHYNYKIYEIFSGVVNEYLDKGGDILSYSSTLLAEARRSQSNINKLFDNSIKHLFSFMIMWSFSFLILIVARVSLIDFYHNFLSSEFFIITISAGFLFFIGTFIYYFMSLNLKKFIEEGQYETK